ncbi:hypothetical protein QAD02_007898 [Eretmocerus hayati]|uniref:Uncharacterized protein n=1 Tax=Eretmocerus hayati TaxID=131215 RepID=A0ACC2N6D5_9HYME|nr:hypothetical protein QAD02_007898 [Eretmocerus hayati]
MKIISSGPNVSTQSGMIPLASVLGAVNQGETKNGGCLSTITEASSNSPAERVVQVLPFDEFNVSWEESDFWGESHEWCVDLVLFPSNVLRCITNMIVFSLATCTSRRFDDPQKILSLKNWDHNSECS